MIMAVHRFKIYKLYPKKKTLKDKIRDFLLEYHALVLVLVMGIVFLVTLAFLSCQSNAEFLMKYGSV